MEPSSANIQDLVARIPNLRQQLGAAGDNAIYILNKGEKKEGEFIKSPSSEYKGVRELLNVLFKALEPDRLDLDQAREVADKILRARPKVLENEKEPIGTFFFLKERLIEAINFAEAVKNRLSAASNRTSENRQVIEKYFDSEIWPPEDEGFLKQYIPLMKFAFLHGQKLKNSSQPQDQLLLECADLALSLTRDYVRAVPMELHAQSVMDHITDAKEYIEATGGDVINSSYKFCDLAYNVAQLIDQRITNERPPSQKLQEAFSIYTEAPSPQKPLQKVISVIDRPKI